MELQKLSSSVNKKAGQSIKQAVFALCLIAGLAVIGIVLNYELKNNASKVQLYSAQIDTVMAEKSAFIDTVAGGLISGTAQADYYSYVDTMVVKYDDVSAVYICVPESSVKYADGIMTYMSGGWLPPDDFVVSERAWYKSALNSKTVCVSEPYVDEQSGGICITLSKAVYDDNGGFLGVAGLDMYMDDLVSLIEDSYSGGDYVFLVSDGGTVMTHPNEEITPSAQESFNVKDALNGKYSKVCESELANKFIMDYSGGPKFAIATKSEITGWKVVAVLSFGWILFIILGIIVIAVVFGIVIEKVAKNVLTKGLTPLFAPLEEISNNVSKISDGELAYTFNVDEHSEEVNSLSVALNSSMHGLQHYITEIINTVTSISEKNLDFTVEGEYAGDYEKIKLALSDILTVLNKSFSDIKQQAGTVLQYSESLTSTCEGVAETATAQSEAVLKASDEMKKLTGDMEKISDFAASIKKNVDNSNTSLTIGKKEMNDLVAAMEEISDCYSEIAGFVSDINGIATQTSLLALNASIEAARSGEAGKGFAVVAHEIGILANSSSESSEKINDAINRSLRSVEKGKDLVEKTDKTLTDSVKYSNENTRMVNEIVGYVDTQKELSKDIFEDLRSLTEMVETNAASAEENSAISLHMGECANALMKTISEFKLQK